MVQGSFGRFVQGNFTLGVAFKRGDFNEMFADAVKAKGSELTNAHAGLEEKFNDSGNANVVSGGVPKGAIFHPGENAGGF